MHRGKAVYSSALFTVDISGGYKIGAAAIRQ
jgi:hypothetical protein